MPGLADRFWSQATLQGRRWMVERRREAVEQNDVTQLAELLANQRSHRPKEMTSILEIAIMKKSDEFHDCAQLLLRHGADPRGTNGVGTPFMLLAAESGCLEILKLLITSNCSVDQRRADNATGLHRAASNGHVSCMEALIGAEADVDVCDAQGRTPLVLACQSDVTDAAMTLMEAGCDVDVPDEKGRTAVFWAAAFNNQILLEALIQRDCDMDIQGPGDFTPLMIAAAEGNTQSLQRLLAAGADTELFNCERQTALLLAAKQNHVECASSLIQAGTDVNMRDVNEATALVYLVHDCDVVGDILEAGGDPNVKTKDQVTPLWLAAEKNLLQTAILLLRANCDVTTPAGPEDKPPLRVALYKGFVSMVKVLFIACVAMGTNNAWLSDYLDDGNLQDHAASDEQVKDALDWLDSGLQQHGGKQLKSLKSLSRVAIRSHLGCYCVVSRITCLPLPLPLQDYVSLAELQTLTSQ